jgi:hypothetical protein
MFFQHSLSVTLLTVNKRYARGPMAMRSGCPRILEDYVSAELTVVAELQVFVRAPTHNLLRHI